VERLTALAAGWRAEADTVTQRYGDDRLARLFRMVAAELEEAIRATQDELLTLDEAAAVSGYTESHLRHLVAAKTIPNAGRKGAPRIRRGDLPIKPGSGAETLEEEAARAARDIMRSVS
jgi:hypothetical protein